MMRAGLLACASSFRLLILAAFMSLTIGLSARAEDAPEPIPPFPESHPSTDPFTASLMAVARYYPQATISHITALVVHGLSDERIDRIDVDIPRNTSICNKLICAHRVAAKNIVGGILLRYHGHEIRIYEKERALSDDFRLPV